MIDIQPPVVHPGVDALAAEHGIQPVSYTHLDEKLDRGATFLYGQGSYSGKNTKVVLTAVKRYQLAELKELVVEIDPNAFIILQDSHQVLGDGFSRYTKDAL